MTDKTYIKITSTAIETQELNFEDAIHLCFSALTQLARTAMKEGPGNEEELVELKKALYDALNNASSYTLHQLFPEQDMNPDLDVNMVLALENMLMNEQLSQLKIKNPRLYKKRLKELKRMQDELYYKKKGSALHKTRENNKGLHAVPKMPRTHENGEELQ